MCDFYYQKLCFHPERVGEGQVAVHCDVHNCTHCTDKQWQKYHIRKDIEYFSSLLSIAKESLNPSEVAAASTKDAPAFDKGRRFRDPRTSPLSDDSSSRLFRGI